MKLLDEIISGCLKNDRRNQKAFYERYYGYCLKIILRYVFQYDKAIDVLNDGFVKVFGKLHTFHCGQEGKIEAMMMGWMKVIMVNTAIDKLRKDHCLSEVTLTDEVTWMEDRSQSADLGLTYKEIVQQIKNLPPTYRIVFNMYIMDGFSHQEIADQLNIAVGTSKSNLSKARVLLQSYLAKAENTEPGLVRCA